MSVKKSNNKKQMIEKKNTRVANAANIKECSDNKETIKSKELQKKILEILPLEQSKIWKVLKIDGRKCSRLVNRLVKQELVKKTKIKETFMVELVRVLNEVPDKKDFSALLSGSGILAPCCGCENLECNPVVCILMDKWIRSDIECK